MFKSVWNAKLVVASIAVTSLLSYSVMAYGQTPNGRSIAWSDRAACDNALQKPSPSLNDCYDCLKAESRKCQRTSQTPQHICEAAALIVFQKCVDRAAAPYQPRVDQIRIDSSDLKLDVRASKKVASINSDTTDNESVVVRMVHRSDGRLIVENISEHQFVQTHDAASYDLVIDASRLPIRDDDVVLFVFELRDTLSEEMLEIEHIRLKVIDSFDVNRDGVFDATDRAAAIVAYNRGEIDIETTARILRTPH